MKDAGVIELLELVFDKSDLIPGYIKRHLPSLRGNDDPYTHAALRMIMAFASLVNKERVWELIKMINSINHDKTKE